MNENWMKDYGEVLNKLCSEYPAYLDMYSSKECQPAILNSLVQKHFPAAAVSHIAGMQRVGNHIISHWILNNDIRSTVYVNNATTYPGLADSVRIFHCNHLEVNKTEKVVCTYENLPSSKLQGLNFSYIIRDPYNWLASWVNHPEFNEETVEGFIKTYIENANTCDNFIVYNKWFSSKSYRDELATALGFVNKDFGVESVPEFGSGSSFDNNSFNGRGSQMKVLERWRQVSDNPLYISLVEKYSKEFAEISNDICGFSSPNF